jgi:putative transposase
VLKENKIQSMDGKWEGTDQHLYRTFLEVHQIRKDIPHPPNGGLDLYHMVNEYIEFYTPKEARNTEIGKFAAR